MSSELVCSQIDNAQFENGFTRIQNKLLEVILKNNFTLRELKILLCLIRFTNGFNREKAELSVRYISNATGIKFHHISTSINDLVTKNVIIISNSASHKQGRILSLNKDYQTWNYDSYQKSNSYHKGNGIVTKRVTETVTKRVTKKESKRKNKEIYSSDSIELKISELLYTLILKRNPKHKKPDLQNWSKQIDLMIIKDKRTPKEIERVIKWCQDDSFWQNNILSTEKLRKQFDQLVLKADANTGKSKNKIIFGDFSNEAISKGKYANVYQ